MKRIVTIFLLLILVAGCEIGEKECAHEYETNITNATCTKKGKEEQICKKCGDIISHDIEKIAHSFGEYKVVLSATCTSDGYEEAKCLNCDETLSKVIKANGHSYKETIISSTCTEKGYTLVECEVCDFEEKKNYTEILKHQFGDWITIIEVGETTDGLEKRKCNNCPFEEERIVSALNYIDLDVLKVELIEGIYIVETFEEFQLIYDANILNDIVYFEVEYQDDNINTVLTNLVKNSSINKDVDVSLSYSNNIYKFTVNYGSGPINKPQMNTNYIQLDSLNKTVYESKRESDFDNFKINNSLMSYSVETSEQLFYCLERRVLPICKSGSQAEVIYNLAKDVLRNIIDDSMNDFDKIKAIHDWIVMNITYDNDLLNLTINNVEDLNSYRGFYLEGVFIDKRAVCEGISKAFCILANIEGIPCVQVEGYQTLNPFGVGHAWNKVYLDGHWYVIDATSDGVILNDQYEVLVYTYFLISNQQMKNKYTEEDHEDIICEDSYDSFENMEYSFKDITKAFKIESFDEFVVVLDYFEHAELENFSVQFELDFDYGESIVDELQNAYSSLEIYKSSEYLMNGDLITLLKK